MASCPQCDASVESETDACSACGARIEAPSKPTVGPWSEPAPLSRGASLHALPRARPGTPAGQGLRFDGAAAVALDRTEPGPRVDDTRSEPRIAAEVVRLPHAEAAPRTPTPAAGERAAGTAPAGRAADAAPGGVDGEPSADGLPQRERPSRPPVDVSETGRYPAAARGDSSGRITPPAQTAARPLVLASEALRRELAPSTPSARPIRWLAALSGLSGLAVTWLLCGTRGLGLPVEGALLAVSILGMVPMPYPARAASLATVATSGLAVVTWHRLERATDFEPLLLLLGVLILSMALLFRSWHRASLPARALVAAGLALCAGWFWSSQALHRLLVLDSHVQAWLGPVLCIPFALLLLLSLLAFMDSRTTGACSLWAVLLLGWYGLHGLSALMVQYWPIGASRPLLARVQPEVAVTWLSAPIFAAVLATALAQLLAVASADRSD